MVVEETLAHCLPSAGGKHSLTTFHFSREGGGWFEVLHSILEWVGGIWTCCQHTHVSFVTACSL